MTWRIYRLPGSQKIWHVDTGIGTPVVNVYAWQSQGVKGIKSIDTATQVQPRAWIEIPGEVSFFVVKNVGVFMYDTFVDTFVDTEAVEKFVNEKPEEKKAE